MKKYIYVLLVLAMIAGLIGYKMVNKGHAETKNVTAEFVLSPSELLTAYESDEAAADAKYLDKIIEVKGKIKSINEVENGGSISLDTGNDMASVTCEFESKDAVNGIKIGDEVTVKGFCSGKLMDIVLVRCSL